MPQCQFLFSAVLGFKKVTQEIFSELDETKAEVPIFTRRRRSPKGSRRGATRGLGAASPRPAPRVRVGPLASADSVHIPRKVPRKVPTPAVNANPSREGSEALPGTLPEGEIITGGFYITMPASEVMRE